MPPITRVGDLSTGHDDCSAVPAVTGASNFLVNGQPVVCVGDSYASHGCIHHPSHAGHLIEGAPSFFINGKAVGRVGDAISCGQKVAEGANFFIVGNGGSKIGVNMPYQLEMNKKFYEKIKEATKDTQTELDKIIFCLPEIAEAMAEKESNEDDKKGWLYLRDMFYKWLSSRANDDPTKNPVPFWVDIDWVLRYFVKIFTSFVLAREAIIQNAQDELVKILLREGYLTKENREFDFINSPWQMWEPYYYQHHAIDFLQVPLRPGIIAALLTFTFRYLAKGKIEYNPKKEQYTIYIDNVAVFVHDVFNFAGDQYLGYWSCEEKDIDYSEFFCNESYYEMNNKKFNEFRERTGFGNDFLVLSKPKIIDNFNPFKYIYPYE